MDYQEVDLMNAALAELGEETQISDPNTDKPGRQLRVIRSLLPVARDAMLQLHPWRCVLRRRTLAPMNASANNGDWKYKQAYRLPVSTLRVWAVDWGGEWERGGADEFDEAGQLLANRDCILTNGGPATLRVVTFERPPYDQFSPMLMKAMAIDLASRIAGPLQADKVARRQLKEEARIAVAEAVGAETSEIGTEDTPFWSRWLEARGGEPVFIEASPAIDHGAL